MYYINCGYNIASNKVNANFIILYDINRKMLLLKKICMIDALVRYDYKILLLINGFHSAVFDQIMFYVSYKYTWIPLYAVVLFFLFKKYKIKVALISLFFFVLLIVLSDQTSVILFKNMFQRYRPCHDPQLSGMVHVLSIPGSKYGFISSHAANSFAFAFLSAIIFKNKFKHFYRLFF